MRRTQRRPHSLAQQTQNIPAKANRVLNLILIAMLLIVLRLWHLAVIQHDKKEEESRRPQRRVVMEPAKRGTIRDRYNVPLAINKIQYNAAILYSQIRQIPSYVWEINPQGKKEKRFTRKEYIKQLSQLLGGELDLDPERLEDLIYAKASLYHSIPYVIKEGISEKEYYRLKMLEKDWLGVQVQLLPRRQYPQGRVAGDIVGYMGSINRREYENIIQEIASLSQYVQEHEAGEGPPLPEGFDDYFQVRARLKDLEEKAYTINDYVGKAGIEGRFEQLLRGFNGKKSYYSDARGNFLRELPGSRAPLSGQRFLLTISAELQEFVEKLLVQNEKVREARISVVDNTKKAIHSKKQPWIKGGSIVVMDPDSGDILAMASYPRFDPNDFILSGNPEENKAQRSNIQRWFENEAYIAEMWDQKRPMEREIYHDAEERFAEESLPLTWENYLRLILPDQSTLADSLLSDIRVGEAIEIQRLVDKLMSLAGTDNAYALFNELYKGEGSEAHPQRIPLAAKEEMARHLKEQDDEVQKAKRRLDRYLLQVPHTYDKVLLADLCRVAVREDLFTPSLAKAVEKQDLSYYRNAGAAMVPVYEAVHKMAKAQFHETHFKAWRKENEKSFLKQKRAEEKAGRVYAKPYIDYLDAKENELFTEFWQANRWHFLEAFLMGESAQSQAPETESILNYFRSWRKELADGAHLAVEWREPYVKLVSIIGKISPSQRIAYLKTLRSFQDLNRPLLGKYRYIRKSNNMQLEKHLAGAFYPQHGYGYGRSQAYRQAATQGSIFKLVTAYEALVQGYIANPQKAHTYQILNPLVIVDSFHRAGKDSFVGYSSEGKPIPRFYKGGRLPRSKSRFLGNMDLLRALETSSNPYFALLAGDVLNSPQDLANAARNFSYGERTGIDLPGEIKGRVPEDLETNRTGLYSTAIGQHTLVVTPLQSSVMLSALANGGKVLKPKIVHMVAGREPQRMGDGIACPPKFKYQECLAMAGVDFQLFSILNVAEQKSHVRKTAAEVRRKIFMPEAVHKILLEGMRRVVAKSHKESLMRLSQLYRNYPDAISDYLDMKDKLLGKTSTSESMETIDLDLMQGTNMYKHVWFGGIAFEGIEEGAGQMSFLHKDRQGKADLVVVVYLRYGAYGKEAAPLAAQVVAKWREIKARHGS